MVYAKFIKRNGKKFGPYYYKSVRDKDGKVHNIYVGRTDPTKKNPKEAPSVKQANELKVPISVKDNFQDSFQYLATLPSSPLPELVVPIPPSGYGKSGFNAVQYLIPVLIIAILALSFFSILPRHTGFMTANLRESYTPSEVLSGQVGIEFGPEDLIPVDAIISVSLANQTYFISMDEFISSSGSVVQSGSGIFKKSDVLIGGQGTGYGLLGTKVSYPELTFSFSVVISYLDAILVPYNITNEIVLEVFNETINSTQNQTFITNSVYHNETISNGTVEIGISGNLSALSNLIFDTGHQNITILSISKANVMIGNSTIPSDTVQLSASNGLITASTDYMLGEDGFGAGFPANRTIDAFIDLDGFNISLPAISGTYDFIVSLEHNGTVISDSTEQIIVTELFVDNDNDGYPASNDCNDFDPLVSPGEIEICWDDIDNNCDTQIDENCQEFVCINGQTSECGNSTGECWAGKVTCTNNEWSQCENLIGPTPELCDDLDNDCDGTVDEDCIELPCEDNQSRECGNYTGECWAGTQTCFNDTWSQCENFIGPSQELCDNLDNDCDGTVDEDVSSIECGSNIGACESGISFCVNGSYSVCSGETLPINETCGNSLDDDCDFEIDEDCDINSPPVLFSPIADIKMKFNENKTINLTNHFMDPDNDELSFSSIYPDNISMFIFGSTLTVKSEIGFFGEGSAIIYASDGKNNTPSNSFKIISENTTIIILNETNKQAAGTICGSCVYVRNSSGENIAIFDQFGNLDIAGKFYSELLEAPNESDLIWKNSFNETVAWIDGATGRMFISGNLTTKTDSYCSPPENSYIIKNNFENCVSFISSTGNLWLRGNLTQEVLI